MGTVAFTSQVLVAAVLAWSALSKLTRSGFRGSTAMFRQLGAGRLATPLTVALCGVEAAVAVTMTVPASAPFGRPAAVGLLGVLTAGVAHIVLTRRDVRCACFGAAATRIGALQLTRNLALLAAAVAGLAGARPAVPPAHLVVAATTGIVLAVLIVRLEDLVFLVRPVPSTSAPLEIP
ncbi:MAG TPA: MauE/DoxX family redox-associated membrane protein [Pseudonocardiaceae bacterium]